MPPSSRIKKATAPKPKQAASSKTRKSNSSTRTPPAMDAKEAKMSFPGVKAASALLSADIHALTLSRFHTPAQTPTNDDNDKPALLQALLARLYTHISDFAGYAGPADTPDDEILDVWTSFFLPIKALTTVHPAGHMLAARMLLYLASAFQKNRQLPRNFPKTDASAEAINLRFDFLLALDDALLASLAALWDLSNRREMFYWVFTSYPVHTYEFPDWATHPAVPADKAGRAAWEDQVKSEHVRVACLARSRELTRANGLRGGRMWQESQGCAPCSTTDNDKEPWLDTDGPIRGTYDYAIFEPFTKPLKLAQRSRYLLRRSRQFVLDAQRIAPPALFLDRRSALASALARPLPHELVCMVVGYFDAQKPVEHPYLGKLDLAAVYAPFPPKGECEACPEESSAPMVRATCLDRSIKVWNLALRTFHALHKFGNSLRWVICADADCAGHHQRLDSVVGLRAHLKKIVERRCGAGTTLDDVGLGAVDALVRSLRRGPAAYAPEDATEEDEWLGGDLGLAEGMLTLPANGLGPGAHPSGAAAWLYGRTRGEEARALETFPPPF